ncbi:hypothetical protein [Bacillus badius]|uniref:YqzN/YkzM domain-containing protein n=1 Tax=Bacillus badius TaxID=1455 RepID=A0ABR5B1U0_BACBA|nr:hypothetical protein [Bacillus badius]KIL80730.1 hypothetical protein SD77_0578 [Bacillus badius]MED4715341.1 hypothetical protein [Bacillus badius]GLY12215.1 hypothetical protein Bbad01_34310 [Bacillus badius]
MTNKNEQAAAKANAEEYKFYLHELREHSQTLFGVKPEVFDGAVFGMKDIQATKTEVKKRIDAFLKKEVKQ